ncbi:hypothetical protein BU16DRAFT_584337 [Lophium mytilinum]|uniref:Uncharacterized protein n=1 Tax=Lophium mytilinum TaxID=390894 RepID=A0A6A6QIE4_9PEZI|nr:hypothetical protein BU16DRAFT_584337 [Lophium mytilinum]
MAICGSDGPYQHEGAILDTIAAARHFHPTIALAVVSSLSVPPHVRDSCFTQVPGAASTSPGALSDPSAPISEAPQPANRGPLLASAGNSLHRTTAPPNVWFFGGPFIPGLLHTRILSRRARMA